MDSEADPNNKFKTLILRKHKKLLFSLSKSIEFPFIKTQLKYCRKIGIRSGIEIMSMFPTALAAESNT